MNGRFLPRRSREVSSRVSRLLLDTFWGCKFLETKSRDRSRKFFLGALPSRLDSFSVFFEGAFVLFNRLPASLISINHSINHTHPASVPQSLTGAILRKTHSSLDKYYQSLLSYVVYSGLTNGWCYPIVSIISLDVVKCNLI